MPGLNQPRTARESTEMARSLREFVCTRAIREGRNLCGVWVTASPQLEQLERKSRVRRFVDGLQWEDREGGIL
jgi:hypothetical protein